MEKILVTGSSGFIGMHLCRTLLNDGYVVMGIDNMNDYYDVSLKEARLNLLSDYDNFTFNKIMFYLVRYRIYSFDKCFSFDVFFFKELI